MSLFRPLLLAFGLCTALPALAQVHDQTVHFAPGASGATIKGKVTGDESFRYRLGARAGQKLSVQLDSGNGSLYFNIIAPGADEALYNGSIEGNGTTVTLPASGNYVIDVYLMRNAARRGEAAAYTLTLYVQ